ncbi:MAG: hypothetical protein V4553_14555 [Bacteroidota bacterium]
MKNLNQVLLFLLLCSLKVSAQTPAEKLADTKIKQLNALSIDTVLTYKLQAYEYYGYSNPKLKCSTVDLVFLIWADKNHNYIRQVDPCYEREPVIDEMGDVINLLRKHLSEIISEELKPPVGIVKVDGKDVISHVEILHDQYQIYTINLTGKVYKKVLPHSYIDTLTWKNPNINYAFNQTTFLKLINDLVAKRLDKLRLQLATIKK